MVNLEKERLTMMLGRVGSRKRVPGRTMPNFRVAQMPLLTLQKPHVKGGNFHRVAPRFMQRSVVKYSYAVNKYKGQWRAMGRYLQRVGAERENEHGRGFNAVEDNMDMAAKLAAWQADGTKHLGKMIVSPEMGHRMDLKEHVRLVMEKVQADLRVEMDWMAIPHYNTDHFHCHIVMRQTDSKGDAIVIDPNYIKTGFRYRSMEVATRQLGFRLKGDILESREMVLNANRITEIDRDIVLMKDQNHEVKVYLEDNNTFNRLKHRQVMARLVHLEEKGFAQKLGNNHWRVHDDLIGALRVFQISQDISKSVYQNRSNILSPDLNYSFTKLGDGEKVLGRVVNFGLNDQRDRSFLLVEGVDQKIHYIETSMNLSRVRAQNEIQNGSIILLEGKEQKTGTIGLYFRGYESFEKIRDFNKFSGFDRYAVEYMKKHEEIPQTLTTTPKVTAQFYDVLNNRIMKLRRANIIDSEFNINEENLEKSLSFSRKRQL